MTNGILPDLFGKEGRYGCKDAEVIGAAGPHQGVRVLALGQEQEASRTAVLHAGECGLHGSPGRLSPGVVAVEAEHDLRAESVELLEVGLAGGGAQCRHRVTDAELRQGDHVHVPLDDQ